MSRRRKITVGVTVTIVIAIGISVAFGGRGARSTPVRTAIVETRDLDATVTASGQIAPKRSVDISSDITGRITEIRVEEGDMVSRNQLLLRIDPTQYEAAVSRSEALLASARAAQLQSRANLEAQRHQVAQSQASLDEARDRLGKTVLRAPMDGKVTRLAVEEGEVALASTFSRETGLLMTISDLSVMQVDVRVDETDVVRLQAGDSAEVTIDAFPDTTFTGRVTRISQSARLNSGPTAGNDQAVDYDVEITLEDPPPGILPDLSATAKIVTETREQVLSIPIIALTVREHSPISTEVAPQDTSTRETEGVFVIQDGAAQFRPVEVGIAGEEFFEVISGLRAGDSIVAGPYQTVRDLEDSATVRPLKDQADDAERQ